MILMESHLGQPQYVWFTDWGLFHQLCSSINQLRYMSKLLLLLLSSNHLSLKKLQQLVLSQLLEDCSGNEQPKEVGGMFQFLLLVLLLQSFLLLSLHCCFGTVWVLFCSVINSYFFWSENVTLSWIMGLHLEFRSLELMCIWCTSCFQVPIMLSPHLIVYLYTFIVCFNFLVLLAHHQYVLSILLRWHAVVAEILQN